MMHNQVPKGTERKERSGQENVQKGRLSPLQKDWFSSMSNFILQFTVIAMACPTGTSFEPSGTNILAKNLHWIGTHQ